MHSLMLLDGGIGARVAAGRPKQFIDVDDRPIIVYSPVAADAAPETTQIVLNHPEGFQEETERLVADYAVRCATDLRRELADEDPSIVQPEHVASVIDMLAPDVGPLVDSQNLVVRQ